MADRRFGMVLDFDSVKDAQKARRMLVEAGLIGPIERDEFMGQPHESPAIHDYDPNLGGPVWYIP